MYGAGIQDAVERIHLEWDGLRRILLPSAEGVPLEHCLERDECRTSSISTSPILFWYNRHIDIVTSMEALYRKR